MTWSYTELKRKHGEEKALEMLAGMTGYGEAGGPIMTRRPVKESDRCPFCNEPWSSKKRCGID